MKFGKSVLCNRKAKHSLKGSVIKSVLLGGLISLFSFSVPVLAETSEEAHQRIVTEEDFPSATKCAGCHTQIYDEWSSSAHAYAGLSPMFHKFEQKINALAPTLNNFCVRCHQGVGSLLGEERYANTWDRSKLSREGVTCISCHRVNTAYGKVNGERRIVPGNIFQPIYGNTDAEPLQNVIKDKDYYKVATEKGEKGKKIHTKAIKMDQLNKSEFCMSCHQVAVNLGIKLEVVWDQYRSSPAHDQGISCQACHMGKVPGKASGYEKAPVAVIRGKEIEPQRDHHNHAFYGPGYSIAHPGLFPQHPDAERWTVQEWLAFDYRAGWGTEEFEEKIEEDLISVNFPEVWEDPSDREDAREIIEVNQQKNRDRLEMRRQVMENGSHLDGPFFDSEPRANDDLDLHFVVENTNAGHNIPSGSLGAQPELWLNVSLQDPDGRYVWESGYVDSHGDMADLHSLDVRAGKLAHDDQLFNLQTKFLTTNVKGTDREMYLPVNMDIDQLPFLRPAREPVSVMNHPPLVRMEGRSIPPLSSRKANYTIPAEAFSKPGTYKMSVRMRSRAEPIYFMKFVDATPEMEQSMNEWMLDIHPYTVEFEVK